MTISIAAAVGIELIAGSLAAGIATFALTTAVSVGLSFVASMLLSPPKPTQNAGYSEGGSAQRTANMITVREAVAVKNIIYGRRRVAGKMVFAEVTDDNRFLHCVIVFAGHEIDAFEELYLNDKQVLVDGNEIVTTGEFTNLVRLKRHLGSPSQGADGTLINETRGAWRESDRLRGCAYIYMRCEFEPSVSNPTFGGKVYQAGVPNLTAVIRGKKVYDPISVSTYWTPNAALCLADYLCDPVYGIGITYAEIDMLALTASVNACEEAVPLAQGGSEARYWVDGELLSSAEPQENIGLLLGAMAGRLHYDGDKWRIIAGVYVAPTVDLTDDDLRAGPTINCILSRRDLFNSVKGTFVDRANNYIRSDFPPVVSPEYISHDGEQLWRDLDLPLTTSYSRAQRIAKIALQAARQPIRATMPCKLSAWRVQAGDTIRWTSLRYGWDHKLFEVRKATFAIADDGTLGVDLELAETTSAIYDWLSGDQDLADPAPDTNFPDARNVLPPTNLRVTEELYVTRDGGGVKARAVLAWDASPDAFLSEYRAAYREVGATTWTQLGSTDELTIDWPDARPGVYDFGVMAVNHRIISSVLVIHRQSITGLAAAPSPPSNLGVAAFGNAFAYATWDPPADLDVTQGGEIVFRHSPLLSGAAWSDGTTIGQSTFPANAGQALMPMKSGTYMAKFRDSTGQWSDVVSFVLRQQSVLEFTTLSGGTLTEHPGFAGAKTGCYLDAGAAELLLSGAMEFDDVPDVDALASWDYTGGVIETGEYLWSDTIDLGSLRRFRLTVTLKSQVRDVFADFDSVPDVDALPSWDGDITGDEADAVTYMRTTQDDPAGTPTWTAWQRVESAEVEAWGVQLKTLLSRSPNDNTKNIAVSELSAVCEGIL